MEKKKVTREMKKPRAPRGGGTGIRAKYLKRLIPGETARFDHPLVHRVEWYFDVDALTRRPSFGLFALHTFSLNLIGRSNRIHGQHKEVDAAVTHFYAEVCRAMRNVLCTRARTKLLTPKNREMMRNTIRKLAPLAKATYETVKNFKLEFARCPLCHGDRRFTADDTHLLQSILYECTKARLIPRASRLYTPVPPLHYEPLIPNAEL